MSELEEQKISDLESVSDIEVGTEVEVSAAARNIIESLIFASDEPITAKLIRLIVDDANKDIVSEDDKLKVNSEIIKRAVSQLNTGYDKAKSSFHIIEIAGGYAYATRHTFSLWVGKLVKEKSRRRLSTTAVETLAIIAYKQPITKGEVEFIRGVNADYIMKTLLEKDLITITGRAHSPGRPLLYGTTDEFLKHFGLNELSDLPKPREIEELIGETELEVDRRLLAEQQELEFKDELAEKMGGGTQQTETKKTSQSRVSGKRAEAIKEKTKEVAAEEPKQEDVKKQEVQTQPAEIEAAIAEEAATENIIQEEVVVSSKEEIETEEESRLELQTASESIQHDEIHEQETIVFKETQHMKVLPKVFGESEVRSAEHSEHMQSDEHPEHSEEADQSEQSGKGWSKWKTKIKSFFQKLFA